MVLPKNESVFNRLTNLVRVRDIVTPFATWAFEHDSELNVLRSLIRSDGLGEPVLIEGGYGPRAVYFSSNHVDLDDPEEVELLEDNIMAVATEIDSGQFLSGDVSLFDLLDFFAAKNAYDFFVVLEGTKFVGIVTHSDVMKPAARVCLFSLSLEFEFAAMRLCSTYAKECFKSLPRDRRKRAIVRFQQRYRNDPRFLTFILDLLDDPLEYFGDWFNYQILLDCTEFVDKGSMICKCKLTAESHTRIRSVFARAEKLRNACAHPALVDEKAPFDLKGLVQLIHECHDLIDTFNRMRRKAPKK